MFKIIAKCLLLCVLASGLTGCALTKTQPQAAPSVGNNELGQNQAETVTGNILIFNGQASTTYAFSVKSGATVFDVMKNLTEQDKIAMQYQDSNAGIFLESLNGVKNDAEEDGYWIFYVNGVMSGVGSHKYGVKQGDLIEWKYMDVSDLEF